MNTLAAIDIGTLTARLLIARRSDDAALFYPVVRKRAYIRLGENFEEEEQGTIKGEAIERALKALEQFNSEAGDRGAVITRAVSTGIMRRAKNREDLLAPVYRRTGIPVAVISGWEEARLTKRGVTHFLTLPDRPFLIFDLGGGTTEFILGNLPKSDVKSIPLGALVLTEKYLSADPPGEEALKALTAYVDALLHKTFPARSGFPRADILVGTGGTITTLAALAHGLERSEVTPFRMNGLPLEIRDIRDLFSKMRGMTIVERAQLSLINEARARVILAGALIAQRILYFFKKNQVIVCLSDILEGLILEHINGVEDESKGI